MKIVKISFLFCFIVAIWPATKAEQINDNSGCWINCDVKITCDSIYVKNDSVYAIFDIKNISSDTLLLSNKFEIGHSFSQNASFSDDSANYKGACGGGGSIMRLEKDKCKHWEHNEYKAILKSYKWKILVPKKRVQVKVYIRRINEAETLTEISITKSFIYRYNSYLDNYNVCNRDKITIPIKKVLGKVKK